MSGAILAASQRGSLAQTENTPQIDRIANELHEAIRGYQVDDTHCHSTTEQYADVTPREFLLATSLAAMPQASYFPAGFLNCAPKFETVMAARNERARGRYGQYISSLFSDIHLTNAMVDTGCCDNIGAPGFATYSGSIRPCTMRAISRIETIQNPLFRQNSSFEDLESRFTAGVRSALDGDRNFGFKSWGMKWHRMERLGPVKPHYDSAAARKSWEDYKRLRGTHASDREEEADRGRRLKEYFLTIALEECMKRDMPMQIHSGDGEAPGVILRRQNPYNLEEVVRFDRDGMMRMPN